MSVADDAPPAAPPPPGTRADRRRVRLLYRRGRLRRPSAERPRRTGADDRPDPQPRLLTGPGGDLSAGDAPYSTLRRRPQSRRRRRVGRICDAHRRPGAVAPDRPREPPASPRAVRLLRPGQPRRILGRAVRRGVLRRPRSDADRRDPRTDPRAPGRLGPLIYFPVQK